jgi:D-lactate dehydrogenase (cytochrome)
MLDIKLDELRARLGEKVTDDLYAREAHGRDENATPGQSPLAVVYAETVADIQTLLAWANETQTAVIAFGAGTSFEGHIVPQGPAISLDLSRMNRIERIASEDFLAEVQPGVTRVALNDALRATGLFFPVDPGADASLGGMAATNASGTTTVRYGGMRANIMALEVALANGELLTLGRPVRKTSSGYDLKDLFIGSAGTLGIITKLTLRLYPVPDQIHTLRVAFATLENAAQAAYQIMASALPVARLEFLDAAGIHAINENLSRAYPEQPTLFIEFHSSTAEAIDAEANLAEEIAREAGAQQIERAQSADERQKLWEARHKAYWAFVNQYPGHRYLVTDTAVPLSALVELLSYAQAQLEEMRLAGSLLGHVGDGNFHTTVATPPDDYARAQEYSERLVTRALELGGTASGEHGIGVVKRKFLEAEHGAALAWMRKMKDLFDPNHILNPGKEL